MNCRRLTLALSTWLLCLGAPALAFADVPASEPSATPGAGAPGAIPAVGEGRQVAQGATATTSLSSNGATVSQSGATSASAGEATPQAPPAEDEWEDSWKPWDTGGEHASLGFGVFGHLGLGHRLNDPSYGEIGDVDRNGLRIGVTAIFRPIRWFGFGIGYEHADLERVRVDVPGESFQNTSRDLNNLWINARAYPLRLDPFALYIDLAAGPSWQGVEADFLKMDAAGVGSTGTCDGGPDLGVGLRGGVGAELALVSGAVLFGEFGPDYYLHSEDSLEGCDKGAGDSLLMGFRAGFALGFEKTKLKKPAPPPPPEDTDRDDDGILNADDACPDLAGILNADPAKNGCPPPKDSDGDGITDDVDACVSVAGIADADPKKNGCPPPKDTDSDGFPDETDACPDIAGIASTDPKLNGCPGDTDGDGFRDDQDACKEEKGVDDPDPQKRGCPKLVRVTATEIIILEQVQFDTGRSTIKKVSDPLLDSVAEVLKEHPEILKLEVQGHTDSQGAKALNQKLSKDRAESVKKALEKRGIDAARLTAKGYGPDKPVGDNKTAEGRQQNRRVQFVVLEKRAKNAPAAAPVTPAPAAAPAPAPAAK